MTNIGNMEEFTIYCTEAQTRKALTLGASIDAMMDITGRHEVCLDSYVLDGIIYIKPTAEQMIGFLEQTFKEVCVRQSVIGSWFYELYINPYELVKKNCGYMSRKEASLAAIDSALEYLAANNLIK